MLTALLSFLGSAFFRTAFERVFDWLETKQEADREERMMRLQFELDSKRAASRAAEKQIEFNAKEEIEAWRALIQAQKDEAVMTGVRWLDAWRKAIRPGYATLFGVFYVSARGAEMYVNGVFGMNDFDEAIFGSILGFYFTDRALAKRKGAA